MNILVTFEPSIGKDVDYGICPYFYLSSGINKICAYFWLTQNNPEIFWCSSKKLLIDQFK